MGAFRAAPFFHRLRRTGRWDVLSFLLMVTLLLWLGWASFSALDYHWQWYRIPAFLVLRDPDGWRCGLLLKGLGVTLQIVAWSLILALLFGLCAALLRLSPSPVARGIARVYLEAVRNTPLLIQLFFLYFVVAPLVGLGRFPTAVLALALFEGAYASEIFRAGILAVDKGQWEAARSLGFGRFQAYRRVILPQALRHILPPLTGQAVSLIKDSALVSTIAILDLTMRGQMIVARTFLTFEIWFTVAAIYLAVTLSLSALAWRLELRLQTRR
ncbi:MAG: amino acid ABC transporter permease [Deltaproteobacteria bacterium]|nr:amino acid ABC transporter permease [Deltaproteobacteria bacterium]